MISTEIKKISNGHDSSVACYYKWEGNGSVYLNRHYHPHTEVFVMTQGKFDIEIGGKTFTITEGQKFTVDAFVPHLVKVYPYSACMIAWFK